MSETETSHEDRTKTRPPANPRREALMAALFMLLLLLPVWWITGEHVRGNLLATAQGQALAELSPHSNALGGALGERLTLLKALLTFALVGTSDEEFLEDHFTRFVSGLYSTTEKVCDLV
ncbi:MAG TPA: hypothetical protein ENI95_13405, partial [Chloroflexi bacterium]|nr:hypothetical protein [Chloroflexota bacterium]